MHLHAYIPAQPSPTQKSSERERVLQYTSISISMYTPKKKRELTPPLSSFIPNTGPGASGWSSLAFLLLLRWSLRSMDWAFESPFCCSFMPTCAFLDCGSCGDRLTAWSSPDRPSQPGVLSGALARRGDVEVLRGRERMRVVRDREMEDRARRGILTVDAWMVLVKWMLGFGMEKTRGRRSSRPKGRFGIDQRLRTVRHRDQ